MRFSIRLKAFKCLMIEKNIEYYMGLQYRMEIIPDPDGGFVGRLPELPGCLTFVENIEDLQLRQLAVGGAIAPHPTRLRLCDQKVEDESKEMYLCSLSSALQRPLYEVMSGDYTDP